MTITIVGPLPVPVTGNLGVTGTVNVRDLNNVVRSPFQKSLSATSGGVGSFTVDANKQLTIEFVTGECSYQTSLPNTIPGTYFGLRTRLEVNGDSVEHTFWPKLGRVYNSGGGPLTNYYFGSTEMTRIYAGPGTIVSVASAQGFFCAISISGYTVPISV